jgi:hypothetical protein
VATATQVGTVEAVYGPEPATVYSLDPPATDKDGTDWDHVLVFIREDGGAEVIGCNENGEVENPQMVAIVRYSHAWQANDGGALFLLGNYDIAAGTD